MDVAECSGGAPKIAFRTGETVHAEMSVYKPSKEEGRTEEPKTGRRQHIQQSEGIGKLRKATVQDFHNFLFCFDLTNDLGIKPSERACFRADLISCRCPSSLASETISLLRPDLFCEFHLQSFNVLCFPSSVNQFYVYSR